MIIRLLQLIFGFVCLNAWAQDIGDSHSSFCIEDSQACRALAIEISILNIQDRLDEQLLGRHDFNLLCTQDNPNCCPPELMPVCSQAQRDLVLNAKQSYDGSLSRMMSTVLNTGQQPSAFDNCELWGPATCEELGVIHCGAGGKWSPLHGCENRMPPPIPIPDCGCGKKWDGRTGCVDKLCSVGGISGIGVKIPCAELCEVGKITLKNDSNFVDSVLQTRSKEESALGKHLNDREVQLEAAQQYRKDLELTMQALDKQIKALNP